MVLTRDDGSRRDTTSPTDRVDAVADALERLRTTQAAEQPLEAILQRLAELAVEAVDGADAVSVTTLDADPARTAAATDYEVVEIDRVQYAVGDGPCLEAARTKRPVRALVQEARERWPDFAKAAEKLDVRAYVSAPLVIEGTTGDELVGALNVYGSTDGAFDPVDTMLLRVLTVAASAAISNWQRWRDASEQIEHLENALTSRAEIDQAKGALMALHGVSADEAFHRLVRHSQETNTKLKELSRQFLASLRT